MGKFIIPKIILMLLLITFVSCCNTEPKKEPPLLIIEVYSDKEMQQMHFQPEDIEKAGLDFTHGGPPIVEITLVPKHHKIFEVLTAENVGAKMVIRVDTEMLFSGKIAMPIKNGAMALDGLSDEATRIFFQKLGREPDYYVRATPEELEEMELYKRTYENPWAKKAMDAYMNKNIEQAEEYTKKAIELDPKNHLHYMLLGSIYRKLGNNELALKETLKAKELAMETEDISRHPGIYINLGSLYAELNDYDKAIECYRTVLNVYKDHFFAQIGLAEVYEKMGEYDLALKEYRSLSKSDDEEIRKKALNGIKRIEDKKKRKK